MYSFWGCGCARMVSQRSPRCRRLRTRSGTDHVDCWCPRKGLECSKSDYSAQAGGSEVAGNTWVLWGWGSSPGARAINHQGRSPIKKSKGGLSLGGRMRLVGHW